MQLSKLLDLNVSVLFEKQRVTAEMENIRSINKDIYREVKNPYLQLFLILVIEKDGANLFH